MPGVAQEAPDALAMWRNGDYERAVEVTRAELEAAPNNLDAMVVMGWSLISLGRYDEAREVSPRDLRSPSEGSTATGSSTSSDVSEG